MLEIFSSKQDSVAAIPFCSGIGGILTSNDANSENVICGNVPDRVSANN
jgi:hypothetical protein